MSTTTITTKTYTVSDLNRQARMLLEGHFGSLWVEGEISNFKRSAAGHWYFSLKDPNAQVSCVMFRSANQSIAFTVEDGQQVKILATVGLYENRGDFQLMAQHLEPLGDGALQLAFESLKRKLHAEGLFEKKQSLAPIVTDIAILTSPTGAVIRDILSTLKRRSIGQTITIYPCEVQGKQAAKSLITMLKKAIQAKPQVIVLARGGGSLEDLFCFNDEALVRAIHACPIPVVSAIGHEVDFTLCDFVADLRAATPTAAAELISLDPMALQKSLREKALYLNQRLLDLLQHSKHALMSPITRLNFFPQQLLMLRQRLDHQVLALEHVFSERGLLYLTQKKGILDPLKKRLTFISDRILKEQKDQLGYLKKRLEQGNPHNILSRGYAIVYDPEGKITADPGILNEGDRINIQLARGRVDAEVKKTSTR